MNELMNIFGQVSGPQSFDQIRISIIREAGGKLAENPNLFLDLPLRADHHRLW